MRLLSKTLIGACAAISIVAMSAVTAEACSVPRDLKKLRKGVTAQVNKKRGTRSLGNLQMRSKLHAAAQLHACWIADNDAPQSHKGIRGSYVQDRVRDQGYIHSYVNENVGGGTILKPRDFVEAWWNSPVHKANILARRSRHIGVGVAEAGGWRYWVMVTGNN